MDIDGVVNALPRSALDLRHWPTWKKRRVAGYTLTVADEVVDWLNALSARDGRFHWATTWTPRRQLLGRAFGLPSDAPVAADPERLAYDEVLDRHVPACEIQFDWKLRQLCELLEQRQQPLLWIDDDVHDWELGPLNDLMTRMKLPGLAVSPVPHRGLQPQDLELMEEFLAQAPAGSAAPGLAVHRTEERR